MALSSEILNPFNTPHQPTEVRVDRWFKPKFDEKQIFHLYYLNAYRMFQAHAFPNPQLLSGATYVLDCHGERGNKIPTYALPDERREALIDNSFLSLPQPLATTLISMDLAAESKRYQVMTDKKTYDMLRLQLVYWPFPVADRQPSFPEEKIFESKILGQDDYFTSGNFDNFYSLQKGPLPNIDKYNLAQIPMSIRTKYTDLLLPGFTLSLNNPENVSNIWMRFVYEKLDQESIKEKLKLV